MQCCVVFIRVTSVFYLEGRVFQQQFLEIRTIAVFSNNDFNDDHMRGDNDSVIYLLGIIIYGFGGLV
mgnify:FL=1